MLAEIFMLRLEANARSHQDPATATERFVPFDPRAAFQFKSGARTR